jgi:hypothetical protein
MNGPVHMQQKEVTLSCCNFSTRIDALGKKKEGAAGGSNHEKDNEYFCWVTWRYSHISMITDAPGNRHGW